MSDGCDGCKLGGRGRVDGRESCGRASRSSEEAFVAVVEGGTDQVTGRGAGFDQRANNGIEGSGAWQDGVKWFKGDRER